MSIKVRLPKLGLFAWDVLENCLTADEVYADFYNIDPARLITGMAIEEVIGQIVAEDRENAARVTHFALLNGKFSSLIVRVKSRGIITPALCYGRCLQDNEGVPTIFTGGLTEYTTEFQQALYQAHLFH